MKNKAKNGWGGKRSKPLKYGENLIAVTKKIPQSKKGEFDLMFKNWIKQFKHA